MRAGQLFALHWDANGGVLPHQILDRWTVEKQERHTAKPIPCPHWDIFYSRQRVRESHHSLLLDLFGGKDDKQSAGRFILCGCGYFLS